MKAMGVGQARPDRRPWPDAGLRRRRAMPTPEQMAEAGQEDAGRACRRLRAAVLAACRRAWHCRRISPDAPGRFARICRRQASRIAGIPGLRKEEVNSLRNQTRKELKCLCKSVWPAPAPRSGRSITSSSPTSRSPRDGRFIERLGYFNPLLPKDNDRAAQARHREGQGLDGEGRAADRPRACASSTPPAS